MAHHGGCCTLDIYAKYGSFYALLISPLFSNMVDRGALHDLDL